MGIAAEISEWTLTHESFSASEQWIENNCLTKTVVQ